MVAVRTRIAFSFDRATLEDWFERLRALGARHVELSGDMEAYPSVFFEDLCGTHPELCARRSR